MIMIAIHGIVSVASSSQMDTADGAASTLLLEQFLNKFWRKSVLFVAAPSVPRPLLSTHLGAVLWNRSPSAIFSQDAFARAWSLTSQALVTCVT
jgi:hypothetical protein